MLGFVCGVVVCRCLCVFLLCVSLRVCLVCWCLCSGWCLFAGLRCVLVSKCGLVVCWFLCAVFVCCCLFAGLWCRGVGVCLRVFGALVAVCGFVVCRCPFSGSWFVLVFALGAPRPAN